MISLMVLNVLLTINDEYFLSIWLIIQRIPTIETMLSKNISFGEIWSLAADQPITITIVLSSTTSKGRKRMLSTIKMVPSKYKERQYLQNYMISHFLKKKIAKSNVPCSTFSGGLLRCAPQFHVACNNRSKMC